MFSKSIFSLLSSVITNVLFSLLVSFINKRMSKKLSDKKSLTKQQQLRKIQQLKQAKKRKKQLRQQQQRQRKLKQQQAIIDKQVQLIYTSGLAEAYKFFLQQAYKEDVKVNIYEYAAQKILKFQKNRKEKEKKLNELEQK